MKHKILIVDDEENILFLMKAAFVQVYDVFTALEGAGALEIIKREKPSFVFLDIKMPGMSGIEVLELIKATGAAPIVWMLTGNEDLDTAVKTLRGGASGYLTKPFDIDRLRGIVASALEDAESRKKHDSSADKPWRIKKPE
jgi:two-component system NtrC family response regulator